MELYKGNNRKDHKMINCKYKDIKEVYDWFDNFADYKELALKGKQISIMDYAYYTPSSANWSYKLGIVKVGHSYYKVVTVFGEIKAVAPVCVPEFNTNVTK